MFRPANGVSNNLALPWKRFIACWSFRFARFGHLNDRDIKQLSHKGRGGDPRVPQDYPLATPLMRREKISPSLVYVFHKTWNFAFSCRGHAVMAKRNVQKSVMQVQSCCFAYSFQPIERFHMTSRRPYWCSKTMKRRPCSVMLVFQTNQVGVKLFSYVKNFFCSLKFAYICRCWPREWKRSVAFLPFSLLSPLWHLKVPNDDFFMLSLLVNYEQTPVQPLIRGHLYSRDTCFGPECVSWIEVWLYLFYLLPQV